MDGNLMDFLFIVKVFMEFLSNEDGRELEFEKLRQTSDNYFVRERTNL